MRCPNCGSKMTLRALAEYDVGPTLGLPSVVVRNLPAFRCASCEDVLIPGPALEALSAMVVRELLTHSFPLGGVEVRFLRKAVGLTQLEIAARLGIDRVSVARWESEEKQLAGPESIAVRAVIGEPRERRAVVDPERCYRPKTTRASRAARSTAGSWC